MNQNYPCAANGLLDEFFLLLRHEYVLFDNVFMLCDQAVAMRLHVGHVDWFFRILRGKGIAFSHGLVLRYLLPRLHGFFTVIPRNSCVVFRLFGEFRDQPIDQQSGIFSHRLPVLPAIK